MQEPKVLHSMFSNTDHAKMQLNTLVEEGQLFIYDSVQPVITQWHLEKVTLINIALSDWVAWELFKNQTAYRKYMLFLSVILMADKSSCDSVSSPSFFFLATLVIAAMTHPEEDVFGGVETSSIYAGCVGGTTLTHDAASIAGDGALCWLAPVSSRTPLTLTLALPAAARHIRHHKVDHALCGTANLGGKQRHVY